MDAFSHVPTRFKCPFARLRFFDQPKEIEGLHRRRRGGPTAAGEPRRREQAESEEEDGRPPPRYWVHKAPPFERLPGPPHHGAEDRSHRLWCRKRQMLRIARAGSARKNTGFQAGPRRRPRPLKRESYTVPVVTSGGSGSTQALSHPSLPAEVGIEPQPLVAPGLQRSVKAVPVAKVPPAAWPSREIARLRTVSRDSDSFAVLFFILVSFAHGAYRAGGPARQSRTCRPSTQESGGPMK